MKKEETDFQKRVTKVKVSGLCSNSALSKFNIKEGGSPIQYKLFIDGYRNNESNYSMETGRLIHAFFEDESIASSFDLVKPSESIKKWVDDYYRIVSDNGSVLLKEEEDSIILEVKERLSLFSNLKKEQTILDKFRVEGKNYLEYLQKSKENEGKIILSTREYNDLINAVAGIKDNEEAYSLLREGNKELKVTFNRLGVDIKCIIDNLIVDDSERKIYITDIKTTSSGVYEIFNYFDSRNYDRQMSLYQLAVIDLIKKGDLPSYEIEVYIVNVSLMNGKSCVLKVSESTLSNGRDKHDPLLREIARHKELGEYDCTIEELEKGYVTI